MESRVQPALPCPGVRFEPGFARRLERLVPRLALAREVREGAGRAGLAGGGAEVLGHRPYRPGDDLRDFDWTALARLDRPFVRVSARESGELWLVSLDASASMGVGPPGKLQRAAEVAAGIAAIGIRLGARVRVEAGGSGFEARKRADLRGLLAFLEGLRADGDGSSRLPGPRSLAAVERAFVVGDLRGARPEDALALLGRKRGVALIQILAPVELAPPDLGVIEWWDPERGARLALPVDERAREAYARELERELESWREAAARHRAGHVCGSSALPFEEIVARSLLG